MSHASTTDMSESTFPFLALVSALAIATFIIATALAHIG
jgi:hypothetical protein